MAADREVIKELLIALGFTIQDVGLKKFTGTLESINKTAAVTATAIASVTAAAEVMVNRFASEFERLYYASQRTGQTVKNIRAIEFAAGQVGLTAEQVSAAMQSMKSALLDNPGLRGILAKWGINPDSKNFLTEFVTLMARFQKNLGPIIGPTIARRYGGMFGIDATMLSQFIQFLPQFLAAQEKAKDIDALGGLTEEKLADLAKASVDYNNTIREIYKTFDLLTTILGSTLLPYFHEFNGALKEMMYDALRGDMSIWEASLRKVGESIGFTADNMERVLNAWKKMEEFGLIDKTYDAISRGVTGHSMFRSDEEKRVDSINENPGRSAAGKIGGVGKIKGMAFSKANIKAFMTTLEMKLGFKRGTLWAIDGLESGHGTSKYKSSAGALGRMQIMPSHLGTHGLNTLADFADPMKNIQAGAEIFAGYLKQAGGNYAMAGALYNGQHDWDRFKLGSDHLRPDHYTEAMGKFNDVPQVIINQQTNIKVEGTTDPTTTAKRVGAEQSRVNGDIVRSFSAVPR